MAAVGWGGQASWVTIYFGGGSGAGWGRTLATLSSPPGQAFHSRDEAQTQYLPVPDRKGQVPEADPGAGGEE